MTPDATRRRAIGQILLLAAGFLVLVAISATSVILVNKARDDSAPGGAHRRGGKPDQRLLLGNPPRRKRRARLSADPRAGIPERPREPLPRRSLPARRQAGAVDGRQSGPGRTTQANCDAAVEAAARPIRAGNGSRQRERSTSPTPSRWCARPAATPSAHIRDVAARCAPRKIGCLRCAPPPPTAASAGLDRDHRRLGPGDRARRHLDLPGAALGARARQGRGAVARQ